MNPKKIFSASGTFVPEVHKKKKSVDPETPITPETPENANADTLDTTLVATVEEPLETATNPEETPMVTETTDVPAETEATGKAARKKTMKKRRGSNRSRGALSMPSCCNHTDLIFKLEGPSLHSV